MQAHGHDDSGHGAQGGHAAGGHEHAPVADPDFDWWLGGTVLLIAVLTAMFVLPATHAAGPVTPVRPLAPEAGDEGHFSERLEHVQALRGEKPAPSPGDADRQKLAELYSALAGGGVADDSVPPEVNAEIAFLIRTVADSGLDFTRDGVERSSIELATYMLDRWENATEPMYSGEAFIRRIFGHKVVDQKLNRVKLANGTDKPTATWLQEALDKRRGN